VGSFVSAQEVTSIKTNIRVADNYFNIEKEILFNEIPSMMK
jgi:hypothetical protein